MQVSETIHREILFFGVSFLTGMGLVLVYDVFRILRRVIKHGNLWVGIEDCLFWCLCTVAVFLLLYRENDGMFRAFAFLALIFGMGVYYLLFSRLLLRIFVSLLGGIFGGVRKISRVLLGPFVKIVCKVMLFFKKWLKKLYKAIRMGLCKL